jgi:hypothetical protein
MSHCHPAQIQHPLRVVEELPVPADGKILLDRIGHPPERLSNNYLKLDDPEQPIPRPARPVLTGS